MHTGILVWVQPISSLVIKWYQTLASNSDILECGNSKSREKDGQLASGLKRTKYRQISSVDLGKTKLSESVLGLF